MMQNIHAHGNECFTSRDSFFMLQRNCKNNFKQYQWIFKKGWEQRKDESNVTQTGTEWWYHWKADELRRCNPSALVPTLIPLDKAGRPNEEKVSWSTLQDWWN